MILEPKHKNFKGPVQIKETVKKIFIITRNMSTLRAFECYYFKLILNWWHSPFKVFLWNFVFAEKIVKKGPSERRHFLSWNIAGHIGTKNREFYVN